jgi:hypothetical protein
MRRMCKNGTQYLPSRINSSIGPRRESASAIQANGLQLSVPAVAGAASKARLRIGGRRILPRDVFGGLTSRPTHSSGSPKISGVSLASKTRGGVLRN